ncbi:MAG: TetR/AcrR family transcriptional regulator, partial [Lachnospiraceae bacterium]|nr:TetR/AcrR family transcriptional regulator [Lachnospiraceae bacterium]
MANFTKNAIKQTFVTLLEEKPYNEITVKEIVSRCGINRNSFYYHYQDLPTL